MDARSPEALARTTKRIDFLQQRFAEHSAKQPMQMIKAEPRESMSKSMAERMEHKYAAHWLVQFYWMTWRTFLSMRRNKMDNFVRIFQVCPSPCGETFVFVFFFVTC